MDGLGEFGISKRWSLRKKIGFSLVPFVFTTIFSVYQLIRHTNEMYRLNYAVPIVVEYNRLNRLDEELANLEVRCEEFNLGENYNFRDFREKVSVELGAIKDGSELRYNLGLIEIENQKLSSSLCTFGAGSLISGCLVGLFLTGKKK